MQYQINWEVDAASGSTLIIGEEQDAKDHFRLYFEPYGYKLVSIQPVK